MYKFCFEYKGSPSDEAFLKTVKFILFSNFVQLIVNIPSIQKQPLQSIASMWDVQLKLQNLNGKHASRASCYFNMFYRLFEFGRSTVIWWTGITYYEINFKFFSFVRISVVSIPDIICTTIKMYSRKYSVQILI